MRRNVNRKVFSDRRNVSATTYYINIKYYYTTLVEGCHDPPTHREMRLDLHSHLLVQAYLPDSIIGMLLLVLANDTPTNPSPIKFPCGTCNKPVASNQKATCCDSCNTWFHTKCTNISNKIYSCMNKTNMENVSWYCPVVWPAKSIKHFL